MVYTYTMNLLSEILSSKVRAEVFRILFGAGTVELHLRELERNSGCAIGTVQTEMKKLSRLELVSARRNGNRLYYRANREHPLYPEIHGMVLKTVGLADTLRGIFAKSDDVLVAFVFGSVAAGTEHADSDIDLIVIGALGLRSVAALLSGVATSIGREVNPHVISIEEFCRRRAEKEHFISSVLASPKIFVKGAEGDFEKLV